MMRRKMKPTKAFFSPKCFIFKPIAACNTGKQKKKKHSAGAAGEIALPSPAAELNAGQGSSVLILRKHNNV